jgi:hypothetical protein
VKLGTSADNLFVVQQIDKSLEDGSLKSDNNAYSFIKLNNEKKTIDFSATEADRGGLWCRLAICKTQPGLSIQPNHYSTMDQQRVEH